MIYTNIKPYNFKVRITGLINNQKVIFGDDTSQYRALIVDKDGIYDINWEDNHKAYCIWIDFIGECDITITQLPTSILKDFSGDKQDTDTLFIGTIRKDDSRSFIGCHGDILLFNRTLTEYEISWVKNNMMCSKQQEPDIGL